MMRGCVFALLLSLVAADSSNGTSTTTTVPVTTTAANNPERNTTTTEATTTSSPATTTVSPAATVPVYNVRNGSTICLMVEANFKLNIHYYGQKGENMQLDFYINASSAIKPTVHGKCTDKLQTLSLEWWPHEDGQVWQLGFQFVRLDSGHFSLDSVQFNYTLDEKLYPSTNDTTRHMVVHSGSQFKCTVGSYYQCMAKQTSTLVKAPSVPATVIQPDVFLVMSNWKAEAFRTSNSSTFVGTMTECSADYVPNKVVPIVVGVALALMIVIALITFIIGSRRRQAGYHEI